jgi:hypothetical protein
MTSFKPILRRQLITISPLLVLVIPSPPWEACNITGTRRWPHVWRLERNYTSTQDIDRFHVVKTFFYYEILMNSIISLCKKRKTEELLEFIDRANNWQLFKEDSYTMQSICSVNAYSGGRVLPSLRIFHFQICCTGFDEIWSCGSH